jgi:hypothetical protein
LRSNDFTPVTFQHGAFFASVRTFAVAVYFNANFAFDMRSKCLDIDGPHPLIAKGNHLDAQIQRDCSPRGDRNPILNLRQQDLLTRSFQEFLQTAGAGAVFLLRGRNLQPADYSIQILSV